MAGGGPEFGSSGKKSLNAEVNLVPFIDLLSVCICFLLMTAVWVQLGSLEVKQTFGTSANSPPNSYELEVKFAGAKSAQILVKQNGKAERPLVVQGETPESMRTAMENKVGELVEKRGIPASAILNPHKDIAHGDMVAVMDLLRKKKISSLGIAPSSVGM